MLWLLDGRHLACLMRRHLAMLLEHVVPAALIKYDAPALGIGRLFDDGHPGRGPAASAGQLAGEAALRRIDRSFCPDASWPWV
jgi:hypothetical protein